MQCDAVSAAALEFAQQSNLAGVIDVMKCHAENRAGPPFYCTRVVGIGDYGP